MERKINVIVDNYMVKFKNDIMEWMNGRTFENIEKSEFIRYIFDYNILVLSKEDFMRRKRVKNVVPHHNRCTAKRANAEQCTRRKKDDTNFCGTHNKGRPHGEMTTCTETPSLLKKKNVWVEEIMGIKYFIDNEENVYDHADVLNDTLNPRIIAKYVCENGKYKIPEYEK